MIGIKVRNGKGVPEKAFQERQGLHPVTDSLDRFTPFLLHWPFVFQSIPFCSSSSFITCIKTQDTAGKTAEAFRKSLLPERLRQLYPSLCFWDCPNYLGVLLTLLTAVAKVQYFNNFSLSERRYRTSIFLFFSTSLMIESGRQKAVYALA